MFACRRDIRGGVGVTVHQSCKMVNAYRGVAGNIPHCKWVGNAGSFRAPPLPGGSKKCCAWPWFSLTGDNRHPRVQEAVRHTKPAIVWVHKNEVVLERILRATR